MFIDVHHRHPGGAVTPQPLRTYQLEPGEARTIEVRCAQVLVVREAKGGKDRVVMLPRSLEKALMAQVATAREVWASDRKAQAEGVEGPDALAVKYPDLGRRWGWFWVFPSAKPSVDPRSGAQRRHHLYEERLQQLRSRRAPLNSRI